MLQAFGPDLLQKLALVRLRFQSCQQRFLVGLILGASSTRTAVAGFVAAAVGVCVRSVNGRFSPFYLWLLRSLCSKQSAFCQTQLRGMLPENAGFVDTARVRFLRPVTNVRP